MFGLIPFRTNNDLQEAGDSFERFVNNFFNDDFAPVFHGRSDLRADIKESKDNFTVKVDLTGVKKEDIAIDYNNNNLVISAKRNEEKNENEENYIRKERSYGEFTRSFYVENIEEENIKAKFNDGELEIILPKKNKNIENSRKIAIE